MLKNQIIDKETKYWKSIFHLSDVNVVAMWTHLETVGEAARDTRVKAATDLLLSSLVTPSSPPASVAAAAERGRDVGDGGVQLLPEKTIWQ